MSAPSDTILDWARKVQAIAHNGLAFAHDPFDRERYHAARGSGSRHSVAGSSPCRSPVRAPSGNRGATTLTPKVDVRGGVFDGDTVLLVRGARATAAGRCRAAGWT